MRASRALPDAAPLRNENGAGIVDIMFAVIIAMLISAAVVSGMSQLHRASSASQNQVIAAAIGQEVLDAARNLPFDTLSNYRGTHTLLVNADGNEEGPPIYPRPLMQDRAALWWSTKAARNDFDGEVLETVSNGPLPDTLMVTVTVSWRENSNDANKRRRLQLSTLISRLGIHT